MNIKQIAVTSVENNQTTQCNFIIVALSEDNKIYVKKDSEMNWEEQPLIAEKK